MTENVIDYLELSLKLRRRNSEENERQILKYINKSYQRDQERCIYPIMYTLLILYSIKSCAISISASKFENDKDDKRIFLYDMSRRIENFLILQ